ncbi:uncharacterized protein N7477_001894 [Penicillium maclennaniae]|uniref:uncharacterized protein n=1 Tax=Penicillium maclennaniae TaxID=1343394 RepID=UPI00253FCFED|nr:uncharacterized protein N7477_001894 [Penicillium maclennaniae]KAJ5681954.1 hypothetical protein N7477_001894 [Penicillium maclennaniae]
MQKVSGCQGRLLHDGTVCARVVQNSSVMRPEYYLVVSSVGIEGLMLGNGLWGSIYGWPEV